MEQGESPRPRSVGTHAARGPAGAVVLSAAPAVLLNHEAMLAAILSRHTYRSQCNGDLLQTHGEP